MRSYYNFINNEFITTSGEPFIDVFSPASEEHIARVLAATPDQVIKAVSVAEKAQQSWRALPSIERARHLHELARALDARAHPIGEALALESGKSLNDAIAETHYAAEILRYHAEWARRIEGEIIPSDNPNENLYLHREPLGVITCLIPFNYPVYTLLRKIAPALITGNTVVVRPSNNTPCSSFEIAQAVIDAKLPSGIINIMAMTHSTAAVLCTHPHVRMITLTGSVGAGRKVLEYSQVNIAKVSLELGGKTPVIIEADANLTLAVDEIVSSKTTHCGQLCTAAERIYVHTSIHDEFVHLLKQRFINRKFGDRASHPHYMGPLVNANARLNIHQMVERAVDDGATLAAGGYLPEGKGFFYPPTLLTHCRQDMEIVQEEVFGPVLSVLSYEDGINEALALANDHQFGLASVLYTENYRSAMHAANAIQAGELYVNRMPADPYQGYHAGWKRSGLGGDDGKHGMLEFTQTRLVVMKY